MPDIYQYFFSGFFAGGILPGLVGVFAACKRALWVCASQD